MTAPPVPEVLAVLDGLAVGSILVKAAGTLASLLAAGSALFAIVLGGKARRYAARLAVASAAAALTLLAGLVGMQAAFLGGGLPQAALDPALLAIVMDSPLGTSAGVRAAGLALVCAVLVPGAVGSAVAGLGAVLVAASFALAGHALGEPRVLLGPLVALHVLAVSFWVGAFAPLHRIAGRYGPREAGEVAHRFGSIAVPAVVALVVAGLALALLLAGGVGGLVATAYGRLLLAKVALAGLLLALAALNKLRLTPALLAGHPGAAGALRRSIRWEGATVVAILLVTVTVTTLTSPGRAGSAAGTLDRHLPAADGAASPVPTLGRLPEGGRDGRT